jgi:DNA-binding beta-propeller fold protein YncE
VNDLNLRIGMIGLVWVLAASTWALAEEAKFTAKPAAVKAGDSVKVSFAVSACTDVEVAMLDGRGTVVRHLAAGLLGPTAPEPFQKDSLAQQVVWDGKDDAGRSAGNGPFKARVRLGLRPKRDKILGRNDNTLSGDICALTTNPKGELFVLLADAFRGRAEIRVLDRQGKYLRTIMPYPANTPEARTETVGHVKIDGRRQPLVFNGQAHSLYPLTAGIRGQSMAWHPDGFLVAASAVGSMCNHGPPRHLLAFHPEGGAPEKTGFVGPEVRKARGFMGGAGEGYSVGMDRLAVSPDGQRIYLVQDFKLGYFEKGERQHGVYRLRWSDKELGAPWLGRKEPGDGDEQFNDPQGLAVDKQGRLYVCDRGNGRVKIYSLEGKLLGKFAVPDPEQIAVSPASGEIYLLCRKAVRSYELMNKNSDPVTSRVLKFGPWSKGEAPRELGRLEYETKKRVAEFMALDSSAKPPRLWVSVYTGYARPCTLVPIDDEGERLNPREPVGQPGGLHYPTFLAADPQRNRVIVSDQESGHTAIDLETGNRTPLRLPGNDFALDKDGNIYLMGGYDSNALLRFDPQAKPLPFSATGTNKLAVKFRGYGPNMGLRGHCIAPNGDLYVRRSPDHACVATVDVFHPDGTLKKAGLINGAGSGDSGIGVDNRGNIYLGMNLKPAAEPIPTDFAKIVPAAAWGYYRKLDRQPPWSYLYANPYLFHMGAIFKFGPEGGQIYGDFSPKALFIAPSLALANAPADAVAYKSGYLGWDVKVVGAKWRYPGIGIIPHSFDRFTGDDGCECLQSQLDADPYGRVYAPSAFYSSVEMVDSAGNRLARIGAYGNADSAGPGSKVSEPEIAFAWPAECDYAEADGKLYVSDSVNRRVMVVRFDAGATESCDVR